jgi:hypothetical protein
VTIAFGAVTAATPVYVAVTSITGVPSASTATVPLTLTGTVAPGNATIANGKTPSAYYTQEFTITVTAATQTTPPVITKQPTSMNVEYGGTATFTVEATGAASYRWQHLRYPTMWKNKDVESARSPTLTLTEVNYTKDGYYRWTLPADKSLYFGTWTWTAIMKP